MPADAKRTAARQSVLKLVSGLPAIPQRVRELVAALQGGDTTSQDIAELIEKDTALSTRVLRIANSPFFGMTRKVASIRQAVVLLGVKQLSHVALSAGIDGELAKRASGFPYERFSAHSLAAAFLSRTIAHHRGVPNADETFVAGMVHDVGEVILAISLPQQWLQAAANPPADLAAALALEEDLFGVTHVEAGAILLGKWNLPDLPIQATAEHHQPIVGDAVSTAVDAVKLGDFFAIEAGFPGLAPWHQCDKTLLPIADRLREFKPLAVTLEQLRERKINLGASGG